MKCKQILVAVLFISFFISCKKDPDYVIERPETPLNLQVSKGDTSVFINWDGVSSAENYLIVRGLTVIAEGITGTSFEDKEAPDTAVEYRLYSVNAAGWRSYRYIADTGYVAIPSGILPRPPVVTATTNDFRGVTLTLTEGRFATSYKIYRDGVLLVDNLIEKTFTDVTAPVSDAEYTVYGVNYNGISTEYNTAVGRKALVYDGSYEDKDDGYIIQPWTFVADNIGYYTEGGPVVKSGEGVNATNGLMIVGGKAQLLYDWGGVAEAGKYKISVMVKKSDGGFWMSPSFSGAIHVAATGNWESFSITTDVLAKGDKFNLKVEPYGSDAALIDNWTIEYVAP